MSAQAGELPCTRYGLHSLTFRRRWAEVEPVRARILILPALPVGALVDSRDRRWFWYR